jgi:hypothetical protein
MNRARFALLALALVLTFAGRAPKADAACLFPCSGPDGSFVRAFPSNCCTVVAGQLTHTFQRYALWMCTAGCAHPTNPPSFVCSTDVCEPV